MLSADRIKDTEHVHDQQDSRWLPEPARHRAGVDGGGMPVCIFQAAAHRDGAFDCCDCVAVALEHADDVSVDWCCA